MRLEDTVSHYNSTYQHVYTALCLSLALSYGMGSIYSGFNNDKCLPWNPLPSQPLTQLNFLPNAYHYLTLFIVLLSSAPTCFFVTTTPPKTSKCQVQRDFYFALCCTATAWNSAWHTDV